MNFRIWHLFKAYPIIFCLATAIPAFAASPIPANQQGHGCHLPGFDQRLRCINVTVPADYQHPEGEKLTLHVTLAPSLREASHADPLFILAGGPGQAGSEILSLVDTAFRKARGTRDVIFIDQRGTGLSGKLDCESTQSLENASITEQEKVITQCMHKLNKQFASYNTENSARDLEQIRIALGYQTVNVWGSSYGTRLGQAYARLYPSSVRSLVLDAVAAPEQILFVWGHDAQAALDASFKHCIEDLGCKSAYPSLTTQFSALLQRVNNGEIKLDFYHPRTAKHIQMQLNPDRFVETIRTALYSADGASRLPFLIDSADKGNWNPFLAQMYSGSDDFTSNGPSIGLMLSVTCAEDIPRVTPAIVAEEEHNSFLKGLEVKQMPAWCRAVNVPPIPYKEPSIIATPVMLLSGALDPVTPPYRAASAARYMTHAQQFVVANVGHGVSQYGCAPTLLREFLDHPEQPVAAECLKDIPLNSFQIGAAGPHP